MKKALAFLLICFFAVQANAGVYLYGPKNKLITYQPVIKLTGIAKRVFELKVNNIVMPLPEEGGFSYGLVLKPGKNLVKLDSLSLDGVKQEKRLHILHLKTYPDMEQLYNGKKHWAKDAVVKLSSLGYIEGYPDGNFYPSRPVTRGEFATWLARIMNLKPKELSQDPFYDVPKEHWRAPYVNAAVKAGYIKPQSQDFFGLDEKIARRDAARIAVRAEGLKLVGRIYTVFSDVSKTEGEVFIYTAYDDELVKGVSASMPIYDPERPMTRAEAAILLSRFKKTQQGFQALYNFNKGYTGAKFCHLNVDPKITEFVVEPKQLNLGMENVVLLQARVKSRKGFQPLTSLKVDLTSVGGLPDVEMYDDGKDADLKKGDLIYSLKVKVTPKKQGEQKLQVTATDKLGWEGKAEKKILVL